MRIPVLETRRLLLRGLTEADLPELARIFSDAQTMRYIGDGKALGLIDSWRSLASTLGHWELRGYGLWGVEEKSTGRLVGRVGLHYPAGWPGLEVGWLVDRRRWGESIAPEAAARALEFAWAETDAAQVISVIHRDNRPSVRVAEKIGERFLRKDEIQGLPVRIYGIDRAT